MTFHRVVLPEELVREILTPLFDVPDELFSDNISTSSPFCRFEPSSSELLTVCKQWLRVATPLLYSVVVLRSKPQAQALCYALKQNKDVGMFVRRIRLEGAYGAVMRDILLAMPNIKEIFISLDFPSSDNPSGLCKALPMINPSCVILHDMQNHRAHGENNGIRMLNKTLVSCLSSWTNMTTFHFPYHEHCSIGSEIASHLRTASNLCMVYVNIRSKSYSYSDYLASNPISSSLKPGTRARLEGMLSYTEEPPTFTINYKESQPINSSIMPMHNVDGVVYDALWSQILYFAMYIPEYKTEVYLEDYNRDRVNRTRKSVSLVSKVFNRLALPFLYGYPVLMGISSLEIFALRLRNTALLRQHVRSLFFSEFCAEESFPFAQYGYHVKSLDLSIIPPYLPNLQILRFAPYRRSQWTMAYSPGLATLSWQGFSRLANMAKESLLHIDSLHLKLQNAYTYPPLASFLAHLSSIQSLDINIPGWADEASLRAFHPNWLSSLRSLRLREPTWDVFVDRLADLDLPKLEHVHAFFGDSRLRFLVKHGSKLRSITMPGNDNLPDKDYASVLDLCPNIELMALVDLDGSLRFTGFRPSPQVLEAQKPHHALAKIVIGIDVVTELAVSRLTRYSVNPFIPKSDYWTGFLACFFWADKFPMLREVQIIADIWPTSEFLISKSNWPQIAMDLMDQGVKLTDRQGRAWRPRLTKFKR